MKRNHEENVLKYTVLRPSASLLFKLIAFEMTFHENNENLLVAMILFQVIIPYGINNQNLWRPLEQRKREKKRKYNKRNLILETSSTA